MWPKLTIQARFKKHPRRPLREILDNIFEDYFGEKYDLGWMLLGLLTIIIWDLLWVVGMKLFEDNFPMQILICIIWVAGIVIFIGISKWWLTDY